MKISVIVPVYNSELFLEFCIQSIIDQTYKNFELLLINDGSTDSSGMICDDYALSDDRIKVLHKRNGGVSSARNLGLKNAVGEWITFIDSDDYISENYFEIIQGQSDSDFILLNAKRLKNSKIVDFLSFDNFKLDCRGFLDKYSLYPYFPAPWAKFLKRNILEENRIFFNENLHFGEDALFNIEFLKHCKVISTLNKAYYIYRDTENGLSKLKLNVKTDEYYFNSIKTVLKDFDKESYLKNIMYPLNRLLLSIYCAEEYNFRNKEKLIKKLVSEEFESLMFLYRKSMVKYLIKFSYSLSFYYILNIYFYKKLSC